MVANADRSLVVELKGSKDVHAEILQEVSEFSFVLGGPVYRLLRRIGLCGERLDLLRRRMIIIAVFAWLPLLLLSLYEGRYAHFDGLTMPFWTDVEIHVRFLVALPFLLATESAVQKFLSPRIRGFIDRNIIRDEDITKFRSAIRFSYKMRDSVLVEIILIVLVYTVGIWVYGNEVASASSLSWYATPYGQHWNLTAAGYWLVFFSLPLFQFFLIRSYYRILIWFVFLWRVSRLDLNLISTHSDRTAGIGFLSKCPYAFSYFLMAQGALLSGYIADQVIHQGQDVRGFKTLIIAFVVIFMFAVYGPLLVFAPRLVRAKWEALAVYGVLASGYIEKFQNKWIAGVNPEQENLLGTGDIQSLADLSNSYSVIEETRGVPFGLYDVAYMAGLTVMPLAPLMLFVFSVDQLLELLIKIFL